MHHAATRAIDRLIAVYAESHQHPANEFIHCICVPAIAFSLLGLLWAMHPLTALALTLASLVYYFILSTSFAIGMVLMSGAMLAVLFIMPPARILPASIAIFVIAWIGQFIGHKIEGKKPSFFDDLRFLLIGPLFVLGILYRRFHIAY
ncbi:MAG: hypothetical protein JWQ23_1549 [Herminiimonas sp.]|nr:hypothetical protein [Herminiimonas sp.]